MENAMRSLTMYIITAPKYCDYTAAITKFLIIKYISVIPMLPSIHDKDADVYICHIKFSSNYKWDGCLLLYSFQ